VEERSYATDANGALPAQRAVATTTQAQQTTQQTRAAARDPGGGYLTREPGRPFGTRVHQASFGFVTRGRPRCRAAERRVQNCLLTTASVVARDRTQRAIGSLVMMGSGVRVPPSAFGPGRGWSARALLTFPGFRTAQGLRVGALVARWPAARLVDELAEARVDGERLSDALAPLSPIVLAPTAVRVTHPQPRARCAITARCWSAPVPPSFAQAVEVKAQSRPQGHWRATQASDAPAGG